METLRSANRRNNLLKRKVTYYILDRLILALLIFIGIALTWNLYNLFSADFYGMTRVFVLGLMAIGLYFLKERNGRSLALAVAAELSYKSAEEVMYDLKKGEIVCYLVDDNCGTLKLVEGNELLIFNEDANGSMKKVFEHDVDMVKFLRDLMTITNLYKNGVLFTAEIVEVNKEK